MPSLSTCPTLLTVTSVTSQSHMHGQLLSWLQGWQAVRGFFFALCELQAKP